MPEILRSILGFVLFIITTVAFIALATLIASLIDEHNQKKKEKKKK